jgi:putative flavoprotein involved in K+ transport
LLVDAAPAIGHAWRSRWDSLRLFTPAEYDALPGMAFPARAGTYPNKDEVADYLTRYVEGFDLPVRLNTRVTRLTKSGDRFIALTTTGTVTAAQVVVATGPFQQPIVPAAAADLSADVVQMHSTRYRNADQLPPGPVLIVGAGNSGVQIASEISRTRDTFLSLGSRPPALPQRFLGRDLFWWMTRLGLMNKTADSRLVRRMRAKGDPVIGTRWSDLDQRGVRVRARVTGGVNRTVSFADGSRLDVAAVIWATGFRPDYSWLQVPGILNDGVVVHQRGITDISGLSFLGLPWQHTRGSALLGFVQDDARWLAQHVMGAKKIDVHATTAR